MLLLTRANTARAALLLGAGLSFVTPVWAQNAAFDAAADNAATAPLQAALNDGKTPMTLQASALDASWRRFKIDKSFDSNFKTTPTANEESVPYSYLTRGETLKVGDENFLIAYRTRVFKYPPLDAIENSSEEDYATNATNPDQYSLELAEDSETLGGYLRLFSTQTLRLCLLNTRTIDGLGDIRAFDAKADLINIVTTADKTRGAEQALEARAKLSGNAVNNRVDSDLKQIGLALLMYTQDYDEKLPPMRSSQSMADIAKYQGRDWDSPKLATVQQVLEPYMKAQELFAHPTTREIYRPNLNLSGRNMANLEPSSKVVTFYEASPAPDGTRAVAYLDGHVKRERETDWLSIRIVSDAIAPPFGAVKSSGSVTTNKFGATVTLYDSAAMTYMYRRQRDNKGRPQTVYLSNAAGRLYYRDPETHQAIFLSSPDGKTAPGGITIPAVQAQEFREFQGYNGQPFGRTFGSNTSDVASFTPKIKIALSDNYLALQKSNINVDTVIGGKTITLTGTVTSNAQKTLAAAIAKKNAPGFRIMNQLVVK